MPAWKYKVNWIKGRWQGKDQADSLAGVQGAIDFTLNELGKQGWEVAAIFQGLQEDMGNGWFVVLKQPN